MREVDFDQVQNILSEQLKSGVFLTTESDGFVNTMTIAWGLSGHMWNKKCLTVAVRHSRFTFEMMGKSDYFTVSVPKKATLKKELVTCGTLSGRDMDKIEDAGLTLSYIEDFPVAVIDECDLHFVCKIAYQQSMDPTLIKAEYTKNQYKNHDYHTIYYGEVIGTYMKD